jgi:hypothetical protein
MRRGEAWKPLREYGGWMRLAEKAVFYALLERSNNDDCAIPYRYTPSLAQLAEAVGGSKSTVVLALDHLEWHRWIHRKRVSNPGRGHKTTYQLIPGGFCHPYCELLTRRRRPSPNSRRQSSAAPKGSDSRTLSDGKGSDSRTLKGSDSHPQTRRSAFVPHVGSTEGGTKQGQFEPAAFSHWPAGSIGDEANLLTLFEISPLQPQPPQARL